MEILSAESTDLFVGTETSPLQVVRVRLRATTGDERPARISVRGSGLTTEEPADLDALAPLETTTVEVGVALEEGVEPGDRLPAEAIAEQPGGTVAPLPLVLTVAEAGWRMFMISHFHYDPVWWNTQAAYTETWGDDRRTRSLFQEPGLALVKGHMETARRDPDYKFVLAELDYLKPYWDAYPEDREYLRQLMAEGRLELMGGTYNEPNTNLTSAESTIRNAIYGIGYQRDVLGGSPQTAWQLDAFGHDPQFPGIMADAGITSSSWARGPFHEWGPHWFRGGGAAPPIWMQVPEPPGMQFPSEFDWVAPSGRALLTSFMPNHYSAGWWLDAAVSLEQAEAEAYRLFRDLQAEAATKNVLLPVGTDYSPPNKWVTEIHRDWGRRYVWPKFITAIARDFFDAVREDQAATGRRFSPQTRDMNPVYTGKDVSFIDTKQAQRISENTLMAAEKFATVAGLLGARYPIEAIDKAWRQLLFGAHHDGITGSESDQVYLDLLGGWRESLELGATVLDGALAYLGERIDTSGDGWAVTVFNPLSWARTDVVRVQIELPPDGPAALEVRDDSGAAVPFLVESVSRRDDGNLEKAHVRFLARDVPSIGYRTYRAVPSGSFPSGSTWEPASGVAIENEAYLVEVDPDRGGAIVRLEEKGSGKQLLREGDVGNELRCYGEYPMHPHFGEGPWHLTPDGRRWSSVDLPAEVTVERSAIGRRIRVSGPFKESRRTQEIALWDGVDRVEFATRLDDYAGQDLLFRVRFAADVEGGMPVSEVGNAVVGRGFGFPNADVAEARFTLDNPAYDWFGLGATARIDLKDGDGIGDGQAAAASRAISIAEIVVPDEPGYDDPVRELVVALVRQGVTSTLSRDGGRRYGNLDVDSNLPDVRLCVGGPAENRFVARLLHEAGKGYATALERQLSDRGQARVWVPAREPLSETWRPTADLRGPRELPALIVAGRDPAATQEAVASLAADFSDSVAVAAYSPDLHKTTGRVEDYTVAILDRGLPSFNVETDGSLYLSLMRSCSGWPSGVWIDPPRRTVPDGSNFQFQHWSHTFEYALVGTPGDWRAGGMVQAGHAFNEPLIGRVFAAHGGQLPATTSLAQVEPASAVLTVLKPTGDPLSRQAAPETDLAAGLTFRIYESAGRPTRARVRSLFGLREAAVTNALGEGARPVSIASDAIELDLEPFSIATVQAVPEPVKPGPGGDGRRAAQPAELAPRGEVAQPVFADYWLHNKGPAPIGYQPVSVQIKPGWRGGAGPFRLPITVASERTDAPVAGSVEIVAPPGWQASPNERAYRLAPGAHLAFEASVEPASDAAPGRYFVAARITDEAGVAHEDVVTIDLDPSGRHGGAEGSDDERSPLLSQAIARSMRMAGLKPTAGAGESQPELGGEILTEFPTEAVHLDAGERAELRVKLRNTAASEIRGEVQIISPHETWPAIRPWTQGFVVGPGAETTVSFALEAPLGFAGGSYWALAKVMYFGRIIYTEAVEVEFRAADVSATAAVGVAAR